MMPPPPSVPVADVEDLVLAPGSPNGADANVSAPARRLCPRRAAAADGSSLDPAASDSLCANPCAACRASSAASAAPYVSVSATSAQAPHAPPAGLAPSSDVDDDGGLPVDDPLPAYDVVVIGAGVVGCSIARELAKYAVRVLVIEKGDDVASGASKANSGIVHGGYDERHGTVKSRLAHPGNRMFSQLNRELNFGFRVTGSLVLALSPSEMPELERLLDNGRKNGVEGLRIIYHDEIVAMEPRINPEVYAALHCPHTGITSPYEYTIALAENAVQNGVEFRLRHEVTDIQRTGGGGGQGDGEQPGYIVCAGVDERVWARFVVNAAGLYSDKIASMVGAANFRIIPRKGEYIILDKTQAHFAKHVLFPVPSPTLGKGILVSQTFHGNLLLGPTSRDMSQAHRTNVQVLEDILTSARRSVPGFDASRAITSYAGLRAKSDRRDFIIEESEVARGFVNVAGIDSPGLTSSPAIARLAVDVLRSAGLRAARNPNFNPFRRPIIVRKPADYTGSVDGVGPDPALHVVCRCETVSEAEVVDAINRPLGAHSIDTVKRRTRAGMGWCQGRYCEARVAQLISRETGIPVGLVPRRGAGSSLLPHRRITEDDRQLLDDLSKHTTAATQKRDKPAPKL